jgi:3-deoxy-D-manno-octulosonic-acid transferase
MLNTLYRYGHLAYIGGGFGKSIHNTLEPAAYGLPLIFGPEYSKFEEAVQFVARGGAISISDSTGFENALGLLVRKPQKDTASAAVLGYLRESEGATVKAMEWVRHQILQKSKQKRD